MKYHEFPWNWHPNFLSGITAKTRHYSDPYYYEQVFNHFETNLKNSNLMVVIGYGFGDSEVNRIIKDVFLSQDAVKMVVIGRSKPKSCPELLDNPKTEFFSGGVAEFAIDEVLSSTGFQVADEKAS